MTNTYAAKSSATRAARKALTAAPEGSTMEVWEVAGGFVFRINEPEVVIADPEAAEEAPAAEEITLTAKEYALLTAICPRDDAAYAATDLGSTWTDARELAANTGFSLRAVAGLLGSLSTKGLIYADEEGGERGEKTLQCISEAGCEWLLSNEPQEIAAPSEEPGAELDMADTNGAFKVLMEEAGYNAPRMLCRALRAVAVEWTGTHKQFRDAAEAMGLKPGNASAEYYAGRKAAGITKK